MVEPEPSRAGAATAGWDAEERVRSAVAALDGATVRADDTWIGVFRAEQELPEHGWKLHVSTRPAELAATVELVLPLLLAEGCAFKLARSERVLVRLNDGMRSPATVGKAVTVYPEPDRVRALAEVLCDALAGRRGPRVLSDRRVRPGAPVHYRYGPVRSSVTAGRDGRPSLVVSGPHGETFEGLASLTYRRPAWVVDPFTGETGPDGTEQDAPAVLLGGRYRVEQGLYESARGNVYRAVDETTGAAVVVKQGRPYVGESDDGSDALLRLRNERRVLVALAGHPAVPRFLDHFAHGDDEYLVTTDAGDRDLDAAVAASAYRVGDRPGPEAPAARRRWADLAGQLARAVAGCHERGVLVRDLTPGNVVLDGDRVTLVDLALAHHDGFGLDGATPGYAPVRQLRNAPPTPGDDRHALAMVLAYAATGLTPPRERRDPDLAPLRLRQYLEVARPHAADAHAGRLAALAGDDEDAATAALSALADPAGPRPDPVPPPAVRLPAAGPAEAGRLTAHLLDGLLAGLAGNGDVPGGGERLGDTHEASLYTGSAGIGLELLHHVDRPGVAAAVERLAAHARRATEVAGSEPGLLVGATGVQVFLLRAATAGLDAGPLDPARVHPPGRGPGDAEEDDVLSGVAGTGLGHLVLAEPTGDPDHVAIAATYARFLAERTTIRRRADAAPPWTAPAGAANDPDGAYAHGLAGLVDFLVAAATVTGAGDLRAAATVRAARLADRTAPRVRGSDGAAALSIAASWCQGLAGTTTTLLRAGRLLGEPAYVDLAREGADALVRWVPRTGTVVACCGLPGIGHALLDVAAATGEERYRDAAYAVLRQLLLLGTGPAAAPQIVDPHGSQAPLSWGVGVAGVLGFVRRLRDGHGEGPVPYPHVSVRAGPVSVAQPGGMSTSPAGVRA